MLKSSLSRFSLSRFLSLWTAAALITAGANAVAATYPVKPIRMLVPFGAGGITDLTARATAEELSKGLGQQVVVENRPGAGGNIAAETLKHAARDGYTIMLTTVGLMSVNPHTYAKVPFDTFQDFTFISSVASTPHAVVIHPGMAAETLKAVVAEARARPESIAFGSAGFGSSPHQGLEILQNATDTKFLHVPFKSGAESVTNVIGGQISMTFEALPVVMPHVQSGKLKALAIAAPKRHDSAPDLPTTAEVGFPGVQSASVSGLVAPAGIPEDIVQRLNQATQRALDNPRLKETLFAQGSNATGSSPQQFQKLIAAEYERWGKILKPTSGK